MIEKFFNKLLGKRPTKVLFEDIGNFNLLKEDNMKTIKIIDLLNKIANGEEVPKKIRYINLIWEYDDEIKDYIHDDLYLFYKINAMGLIKNYVEIPEEPKKIPEKLDVHYDRENRFQVKVDGKTITEVMCLKINEILDYLESKEE